MTRRGDVRACLLALPFYTVFFTLVFLRSLLSSAYIAPSDALDFGVADYLSSPSLWTQGLYSGYPIAADPQSLIWYPVLQLFRLLHLGWDAFMVAPFVIAGTSGFLLVRRLTASNMAALFSGLVFGFAGPMFGNLGHFNQLHAAAWMPLVLYGLQLIREEQHRSGTVVTAAAFALMWTAGHPQIVVYTAYLAATVFVGTLAIDRPSRPRLWTRTVWSGAALALGTGLAAVMILPMLELAGLSGRAESNWELYASKALPPWQLMTLVFPSSFGFWADNGLSVPYFGDGSPGENLTYVGLLPLALALIGPFTLQTFRRESRLWMGIAIVAALLCLGAATPVGTLFYYAPGYARFRVPSRHLFVLALCLAVGSGFVVAEFSRRRDAARVVASALAATLTLGLLGFALLARHSPQVWTLVTTHAAYARWTLLWPLAFAAVVIVCLLLVGRLASDRRRPLAVAVLLSVATVCDLAVLHYRVPGARFEYADAVPQEMAPHPRIAQLARELDRTGDRAIAIDGTHNQFLLPNLTRPWGVAAAGGSGPLGVGYYIDLMRMGGPGDVPSDSLLDAHTELDLFSIRYALVPQDSSVTDVLPRSGRWTAVERLAYYADEPDSHYTLFRNNRVRPRAWCASTVVEADPGDVMGTIRSSQLPDGEVFDPATIALVDAGGLPGWTNSDAPDPTRSVRVVRLGRESQYVVNSRSPCLLVLSEVHYPWWRASIDAAPAAVARVNYAMVGIPVPPGSHVVRVWLRPLSVWAGGAVSGICLLAWLWIAASVRRNERAGQTAR